MGISEGDLNPLPEERLNSLDGGSTTPLGSINLLVTFEKGHLGRTLSVLFVVMPTLTACECTLRRSTLGKLEAVDSPSENEVLLRQWQDRNP